MNTCFTLLGNSLELQRYPVDLQHQSWQAWDSADEYLIEHLDTLGIEHLDKSILILNDDFGALACWFNGATIQWSNDSFVARQSCIQNLKLNHLNVQKIIFSHPLEPLTKPVDIVLIKIPKTTALLEHQLCQLQYLVDKQTQIVAAGKAKSIQKSTLGLFEKYIGPTRTSLAKKKSRLIFSEVNPCQNHPNPYPTIWSTESPAMRISNHANVFARQQLDIGGRFLIENLPSCDNKTVVDLGCGNGVVGLHVLYNSTSSKVVFVDESYMAVESAKQNVQSNMPDKMHRCEFLVSNCLEQYAEAEQPKADLVLCNPPFHQQNVITDHIALQMFKDAKQHLKSGGELHIVGNRHLDYPQKIKRLFGGYSLIASNNKFSIISASKP
jgi:16S rRNA (guanine1207-N2)-methyltransferase/23S rRNA (guanine1835-N2)-methyltransferase